MPSHGNCCAIPSCFTRSDTCRGLTYHSLPKLGKHDEWRKKLDRAIDRSDLLYNPDNARICSRHFTEDCFKYGPSGKRRLIPGSLPTQWMPVKSVVTPKPPPRKSPTKRDPGVLPERVAYKTLKEVEADVTQCLPKPWCLLEKNPQHLTLGLIDADTVKIQVQISEDFSVKTFVSGQLLQKTDSVEHVRVKTFLQSVASLKLCTGVEEQDLQGFADLRSRDKDQMYFRQPRDVSSGETVIHSGKCQVLLQGNRVSPLCVECAYVKKLVLRKQQRTVAAASRPLHKYDPLHNADKQKIAQALKTSRKNEKVLQKQLDEFKATLEDQSIEVSTTLDESLTKVVEENALAKLFWKEQKKAFASKERGMKWHPMLIRLAILIHSRSPAAYDTLRNTGVLKLPGHQTLRDYTNVYHPQDGFSQAAITELKRLSKEFKDEERFVCLMHDEMLIKSDLVFDTRSGEIVGYVNPDRWETDGIDDIVIEKDLATHVLCFFVVGINTTINVSLGFFGTATATAAELFPLFWQAVMYLEITCKLKVIVSTCDKASANQKLYQSHQMPANRDEICYKAPNMFAPERYVYFISDPPHLIKTIRNNISNSGSRKNTHLLWFNEKEILWKHIRNLYYQDSQNETRFTKLTSDHVNLTGASCMNVRLAAQTLSRSVGKMMELHGGEEASETARLVLLVNRYFDCLNGRSRVESVRKRNPDLAPYETPDDERFNFLEGEFLGYLDQWKLSVENRPGQFTQTERNKMFLTHQTYKGLVMTSKAFCEATRYLLACGVPRVLGNVFCQDPLEAHFGRHRGLGRRCDNPTMWAFGYQENKLRMGRSLSLQLTPKGNVHNKRKVPVTISTSPMKRKK